MNNLSRYIARKSKNYIFTNVMGKINTVFVFEFRLTQLKRKIYLFPSTKFIYRAVSDAFLQTGS